MITNHDNGIQSRRWEPSDEKIHLRFDLPTWPSSCRLDRGRTWERGTWPILLAPIFPTSHWESEKVKRERFSKLNSRIYVTYDYSKVLFEQIYLNLLNQNYLTEFRLVRVRRTDGRVNVWLDEHQTKFSFIPRIALFEFMVFFALCQ